MGPKSEKRQQRIAAAKAREAALKQGGVEFGSLSYFQRAVTALAMAAPVCLVARFEDGLNHCIEASVCGAEALTRRQIEARVVTCAVMAAHQKGPELRLTTGLTHRQIYDRLQWGTAPVVPFETWKLQQASQLPTNELNTHAIIEAKYGAESALIDLTLGQLRMAPFEEAKTIPWQLVLPAAARFESPDWTISYVEVEHSSELMGRVNEMKQQLFGSPFVDELYEFSELALRHELHQGRFYAEIDRQLPEQFKIAMSRISRLGGV